MFTLRILFSYSNQVKINILGKIKYPMYPPKHFINFKGVSLSSVANQSKETLFKKCKPARNFKMGSLDECYNWFHHTW